MCSPALSQLGVKSGNLPANADMFDELCQSVENPDNAPFITMCNALKKFFRENKDALGFGNGKFPSLLITSMPMNIATEGMWYIMSCQGINDYQRMSYLHSLLVPALESGMLFEEVRAMIANMLKICENTIEQIDAKGDDPNSPKFWNADDPRNTSLEMFKQQVERDGS